MLGWSFVGLVIYLSLAPAPPDLAPPSAFDAGHVVAYFWLMLWFAQIHRLRSARWWIGAAFCVLGVVLEILQGLGGYRTFDTIDMVRNAIGVGIGLLAAQTRLQNLLYALEHWLERHRSDSGRPTPSNHQGTRGQIDHGSDEQMP